MRKVLSVCVLACCVLAVACGSESFTGANANKKATTTKAPERDAGAKTPGKEEDPETEGAPLGRTGAEAEGKKKGEHVAAQEAKPDATAAESDARLREIAAKGLNPACHGFAGRIDVNVNVNVNAAAVSNCAVPAGGWGAAGPKPGCAPQGGVVVNAPVNVDLPGVALSQSCVSPELLSKVVADPNEQYVFCNVAEGGKALSSCVTLSTMLASDSDPRLSKLSPVGAAAFGACLVKAGNGAVKGQCGEGGCCFKLK